MVLSGLHGFRQISELFGETARGMIPRGFGSKLERTGEYTIWLPMEGEDTLEGAQV